MFKTSNQYCAMELLYTEAAWARGEAMFYSSNNFCGMELLYTEAA